MKGPRERKGNGPISVMPMSLSHCHVSYLFGENSNKCSVVDKTRNIPEHPGTSNNYDNYEKMLSFYDLIIKCN